MFFVRKIKKTTYVNRAEVLFRYLKKAELTTKPGSVVDNHSSRAGVTTGLKRPTRERCGPHLLFPYLVLLQVGFTMPLMLPLTRCALTAPFHPYLTTREWSGGIFSVALAVGSLPPGVTWHPAHWSPDFPLPGKYQAAIVSVNSGEHYR